MAKGKTLLYHALSTPCTHSRGSFLWKLTSYILTHPYILSLSHIDPYTQCLSLSLTHTHTNTHTHTLSDFHSIRSLILLEASTRGLWLCLEESLTQSFLRAASEAWSSTYLPMLSTMVAWFLQGRPSSCLNAEKTFILSGLTPRILFQFSA